MSVRKTSTDRCFVTTRVKSLEILLLHFSIFYNLLTCKLTQELCGPARYILGLGVQLLMLQRRLGKHHTDTLVIAACSREPPKQWLAFPYCKPRLNQAKVMSSMQWESQVLWCRSKMHYSDSRLQAAKFSWLQGDPLETLLPLQGQSSS